MLSALYLGGPFDSALSSKTKLDAAAGQKAAGLPTQLARLEIVGELSGSNQVRLNAVPFMFLVRLQRPARPARKSPGTCIFSTFCRKGSAKVPIKSFVWTILDVTPLEHRT